jgi:hypothetical protein
MSEVSICNLALGWLGEKTITSLNDQSRAAQLCAENYPALRDAVIEARYWRFATVRTVLQSQDTPGSKTEAGFPQWGVGYVHAIPTNYLAVFRVYRDMFGEAMSNWTREGSYIISDDSTIFVSGVVSVSDTGKFSNLFEQALAARLAADLAIPLTQNRQLQADMWTLYNDKMSEATVRDGQQGRSEDVNATRLVNARSR